eukprot:4313932-Pleurochrysis_carterae.AAC.1
MEDQFTPTSMREGKDAVASTALRPIRCAAEARWAYTRTSVRVSRADKSRASTRNVAIDRSEASRAEAKGAASTNTSRSHRA